MESDSDTDSLKAPETDNEQDDGQDGQANDPPNPFAAIM